MYTQMFVCCHIYMYICTVDRVCIHTNKENVSCQHFHLTKKQ